MTWPVLGSLCIWAQPFVKCRCLKTASRRRSIASDPEGLTVRDRCFNANDPG